MPDSFEDLNSLISSLNGKVDKAALASLVQKNFHLTQDRSVYYNDEFAIRFSSSKSTAFSNTVISLSALQKYDDKPFFVCLITPKENILFLANSTFLIKVSHSSQQLRINNIKGSINGSDIAKTFNGMPNSPEYFSDLFAIHAEIGFSGNLDRLVEATNNIIPSGEKFKVNSDNIDNVLNAPLRAKSFVQSHEYKTLSNELDAIVEKYKKEIVLASFIENVNIRGRVIEYLIAGEDDRLREELIKAIRKGSKKIPGFRTKNSLGDYNRIFDHYDTATDIKTKVMVLHSMPKAYNLDKMLEFLSKENSVFMFYFVGIKPNMIVGHVLISMFQNDLRSTINLLKHWAGRNTRGVSQLNGSIIDNLIEKPNNEIDVSSSISFLKEIINL